MNRTPIEWCRTYNETGTFFEEGFSVNPVRFRPHGASRLVTMCQKVSPGCVHCYAETITRRFWPKDAKRRVAHRLTMGTELVSISFPGYTAEGVSEKSGEFVLDERTLQSVLKRKKPARIFWGDMTDLFGEWVPDAFLDQCFAVCALTPHLTHMFLTKRPERMLEYMGRACGRIADLVMKMRRQRGDRSCVGPLPHIAPGAIWWPLANVCLGVSVEDQKTADLRIPLLLQTPAAVRFISAEPLLDAVDLSLVRGNFGRHALSCVNYPNGKPWLDWVIVGGESGPGARPMHPDWVRSLRDQCKDAGVPFFFKQWGGWKKYIDRDVEDPDWQRDYSRMGNSPNFQILNLEGGCGFHGERVHVMQRTGKKFAGAELDGVEYREFPEVKVG